MATDRTSVPDFRTGRDYPSPFTHLIALGYYDGATNGVVRTVAGTAYAFDMVGEVAGVDDADDLRRFELRPLPAGAFDRIVDAISAHFPPAWPYWVPIWKFSTDDIRLGVERAIDEQLARAGPPEWVVEATDLARPIIAAAPATPPAYPDPEREYARLLLRLQELDPDAPEADLVRDQMDEPWYRMTADQRERMRGLAADLNALLDGGPSYRNMSPDELALYRASIQRGWEAHEAGDYEVALGILRGPHPDGGAPRSAILRSQSSSWAAAGYPEVAVAILKVAEREDPSLAAATLAHLRALGWDREAAEYADRILLDPTLATDPLAALLACTTAGLRIHELPRAQARPHFEQLQMHIRRALEVVGREPQHESDSPGLTAALEKLLGLISVELGTGSGKVARTAVEVEGSRSVPDAPHPESAPTHGFDTVVAFGRRKSGWDVLVGQAA